MQEHALLAPDLPTLRRSDTANAERPEPANAGQPARATGGNDHDARVIAHYEACGEDFYLEDHHGEHIHFGYWEAADAAAACDRIERSALACHLHRLPTRRRLPDGAQTGQHRSQPSARPRFEPTDIAGQEY